MDDASPQAPHTSSKLRLGITGRWWLVAGGWAVLVAAGATGLIHHELNQHRSDQLATGLSRLNRLHAALEINFRQQVALPRALSHDSNIVAFMEHPINDDAEHLSTQDRAKVQAELMALPQVRKISLTLRETGQAFGMSHTFLLDQFGNAVADSDLDSSAAILGGNFKNRQYFIDTINFGLGSQFALGSASKIPGFYFTSKIISHYDVVGVLIFKQDTASLDYLFDDPIHVLMLTDRHGNVLAGNQVADLLAHTQPRQRRPGPGLSAPTQSARLATRSP